MRKRFLWLGMSLPVLSLAQDELGADEVPIPAESSTGSSLDEFTAQYTGDLLMWAWLAATVAMAYAIATLAFLVLLGNRNPTLAARYALFWGGLAFVLIQIFAFGTLTGVSQDPIVAFAFAIGIIVAVIILLAVLRRKR